MSGGVLFILSSPAEGGRFSPSFPFPDSSDHENRSWSYQRHVLSEGKAKENICQPVHFTVEQEWENQLFQSSCATLHLLFQSDSVLSSFVDISNKNKTFRYRFHQHILIEYNNLIYSICCSYISFCLHFRYKGLYFATFGPIWKLSVDRSLQINQVHGLQCIFKSRWDTECFEFTDFFRSDCHVYDTR